MTEHAVKQFEDLLKQSNRDYLIDEKIGEQACNVRFIGKFNGDVVIWRAHIQTLRSYADQLKLNSRHDKPIKLQQFIEIEQQPQGYLLNVAINLGKIDEAAIKRTIIMIRKYKRLHLGRHEYGDFAEF